MLKENFQVGESLLNAFLLKHNFLQSNYFGVKLSYSCYLVSSKEFTECREVLGEFAHFKREN